MTLTTKALSYIMSLLLLTITIDNRTDIPLDIPRLNRLAVLVVERAPIDSEVIVHIWPRDDIESVLGVKIDNSIYAHPNHIFMVKPDYLGFIQGVLLSVYPDRHHDNLRRLGRFIYTEEINTVHVKDIP